MFTSAKPAFAPRIAIVCMSQVSMATGPACPSTLCVCAYVRVCAQRFDPAFTARMSEWQFNAPVQVQGSGYWPTSPFADTLRQLSPLQVGEGHRVTLVGFSWCNGRIEAALAIIPTLPHLRFTVQVDGRAMNFTDGLLRLLLHVAPGDNSPKAWCLYLSADHRSERWPWKLLTFHDRADMAGLLRLPDPASYEGPEPPVVDCRVSLGEISEVRVCVCVCVCVCVVFLHRKHGSSDRCVHLLHMHSTEQYTGHYTGGLFCMRCTKEHALSGACTVLK